MNTIYKYPLEITDRQELKIPDGYKIASIGLDPNGAPSLWAIVDTERIQITETIRIVGTGQPVPGLIESSHIGSFTHGPFVWHVFLG